MEDKMQEWLLLAATTLLAVLGYVIKRWVEKLEVTERLARRLRVVELYRALRRANLSADDLDRIERDLLASDRPRERARARDSRDRQASLAE